MVVTDNVYRFATTGDDPYINRVVEEAAEETNFILITEKDTVLGPGTSAFILVRGRVLAVALVAPDLSLAGRTLGELLDESANAPDAENATTDSFLMLSVTGDAEDVKQELELIRTEIKEITKVIETIKSTGRRIQNVIDGRTVRVNVESF